MSVTELMKSEFEGQEPQTDIVAGERVRSYDFAGRYDCYMDGVVLRITDPIEGCCRYEIQVVRQVFGGQEQPDFPDKVFPPLNGTQTTFGGVTNLVVRVPH